MPECPMTSSRVGFPARNCPALSCWHGMHQLRGFFLPRPRMRARSRFETTFYVLKSAHSSMSTSSPRYIFTSLRLLAFLRKLRKDDVYGHWQRNIVHHFYNHPSSLVGGKRTPWRQVTRHSPTGQAFHSLQHISEVDVLEFRPVQHARLITLLLVRRAICPVTAAVLHKHVYCSTSACPLGKRNNIMKSEDIQTYRAAKHGSPF